MLDEHVGGGHVWSMMHNHNYNKYLVIYFSLIVNISDIRLIVNFSDVYTEAIGSG